MTRRPSALLRRGITWLVATVVFANCRADPGTVPETTGAIQVNVAALPAGAVASISIVGADGIRHDLSGAGTLANLAPGTYTLTAIDVMIGDQRYAPVPATQTIVVSPTLAATLAAITYVVVTPPVDATLTVTVSGLPPGAVAALDLAGASGLRRTLNGPQVLAGLPPDTYTLVPADVVSEGVDYSAQPASQTITLVAGMSGSLDVAYAVDASPPTHRAVGDLTVNLTGLGAGMLASATVTGPGEFNQAMQSSGTLTSLAPGSYTIAADSVVIGGVTFLPQPATQAVTVSAGGATLATVAYLAMRPVTATGMLTVSINGVPSGAGAKVLISGPGPTSLDLVGSTTVTLPVGTYTVTATAVLAGDFSFAPSAGTQTVVVTNGATATVTVNYGPADGDLVLSVAGLPNGTPASIRVTGPNGFVRTITGSQFLAGLAPGTYLIEARSIWDTGFTLSPAQPAQSREVVAGATTYATIDYAVSSASMTVSLQGLPTGSVGNVTVRGPGGFAQLVSSSQTLSGLLPGTYTISAANFAVGGTTFAPTVSTPTVTLAAGATGTATVTYATVGAPQGTGTLAIVLVGAPIGASPTVTVVGPGGFLQVLTASQTLEQLPPGVYGISATGFAAGSYTFRPAISSAAVNVAAGGVASVAVNFVQVEGDLTISVVGVPAGATGSVVITGPGSFSRQFGSSTTLTALAPGTYSIATAAIASGGFTYSGLPAIQSVTVTSGSTTAATVSYAAPLPTTGSLALTACGLPSGATANLTVTGPDGFVQQVTTPQTLVGLAPGTYGISGSNVIFAGVTYAPSTLTRALTVAAAVTTAACAAYAPVAVAPTVGVLAVTVSGLPTGATGSVTIAGPGGFSQQISTTQSITGLLPGAYTIAATSVSAGGFGYAPITANQTATVVAGATASASVAYLSADGDLAVSLIGLPSGTTPTVTVTGPGGFARTVTSAQLLTALAPGIYTVSTTTVASGGISYAPSLATQTVNVVAGSTASATITFALVAPLTGSLSISLSGLPTGVGGSVTVTGPGSFSQTFTGAQALSGLTLGSYTITAQNVTSAGITYAPAPSTQNLVVVAGLTVSGMVTYTASAPPPYLALTPGYHARTMVINDPFNGDAPTTYSYQIFIPADYNPTVPKRAILFGHGAGERGSNNTSQIGVGLGPYVTANAGSFPDVVVFPQLPNLGAQSDANRAAVNAFRRAIFYTALTQTLAEVNVDRTRVYATGFSGGAGDMYSVVYAHPTTFAALVPIEGNFDGTTILNDNNTNYAPAAAAFAAALPFFPIRVYCQAGDVSSVVAQSRMVSAAYGGPATGSYSNGIAFRYIEDPGSTHATDWVYNDPTFWTWFRAQNR